MNEYSTQIKDDCMRNRRREDISNQYEFRQACLHDNLYYDPLRNQVMGLACPCPKCSPTC